MGKTGKREESKGNLCRRRSSRTGWTRRCWAADVTERGREAETQRSREASA
jgi:hypothetical protein